MKKLTICLASVDVASVFKDFRAAFEEEGHQVISYVNRKSKSKIIEQDNYDHWRDKLVPAFLMEPREGKAIFDKLYNKLRHWFQSYSHDTQFNAISRKADLFIFFYNSIYPDFKDLYILKQMGKKLIFVFVGSDARWYHGMVQDFKREGFDLFDYGTNYDYGIKGLEERLIRIRNAEKYCDLIFSKREQSQLQLRPFFHYPMVLNKDDYTFNDEQRKECPVVVHAPSNPNVKGTTHVLKAFEKLKEEGISFEYKLIENMPHKEAKEEYRNADIVIDQLFIPGAGKLASEAMAMGRVVLSKMAYGKYEQGFPIDNCPIIDVTKDTIYEILKRTILDHEQRCYRSREGRKYVENHLDIRHLTKRMIALIEKPQEYDYEPRFFRDHYLPESSESGQLLNQWTQFVRNEEWYNALISKGDRNGLQF